MDGKGINVILNGKNVEAEKGEKLVDVIRRHEKFFPSPCYSKFLTATGHCGLCLIGARRKSGNKFSTVFACTATASDGMEVDTKFPEAVAKRNELLTLYLMKHPFDCSICNKIGSCFLHKFAVALGIGSFTRIAKKRNLNLGYEDFGVHIAFDRMKCIGCQRCVRFCRDVLGEEFIGFLPNDQGYKEVTLYPGKTLDNNYSLNLVDLCPAGAFIDKSCTYQPMEWELMRTPSISTESSVGVNTYVLHGGNKIFRIIPRTNKYVNDDWIPNSARNEHMDFCEGKRLTKTMQNGRPSHIKIAISRIVESIRGHKLFVVCSGKMSLEDQFVLRRWLDMVVCDICFLRKTRTADNFLISSDATPNFNGAILNGLTSEINAIDNLNSLNRKIKSGQCDQILSLGEDIFSLGISREISDSVKIFYMGTQENETSKRAATIIPTATVFESTGTLVNDSWRLQKFYRAVNPPGKNIFPMWYIFSLLLNIYSDSNSKGLLWLDDVWRSMSRNLMQLKNIDLFNVDFEGFQLKKH
jgi:NADH-quinone oxidoreductase subunit G